MQAISLNQVQISTRRFADWIFAGIFNLMLVIVLLFCTINTLTSIPLDKIFLCVCIVAVLFINPEKKIFTSKEFLVVLSFTVIAVLSSVVNLIFFPMIFFPIMGLCFAIIISGYRHLVVYSLYYALFIHIVIGIILLILAVFGFARFNVSSSVKGFADLYSTHGFTATVQTYGTLCISWLLLYILRGRMGLNTAIDKLFCLIANLAILLTFNRSSYLFWIIVLFFEFPVFFWSMTIFMTVLLISFWDILTKFLLSSASIVSRFQLLQGFEISYMQSHSLKVYLFGRGTDQISDEVAKRVKWTNRTDLENGYTMLLHSYGIIGLIAYISVCFYFIFLFLKINRFKEAFFLFFYFFATQYITQEFVTATFYIFLTIMLFTYKIYSQKFKLLKLEPVI